MVAAMNSVGVDGAIMVSSFSAYEYDPSYALEVYNTYPDKFRVVTPVDATNPAIDDVVAKWAATPGARGIRIRMRDGLPMDADHPVALLASAPLELIRSGASLEARRADGGSVALRHALSPRQVEVLLAGGVINWLKQRAAA
jgi:hypothetical protein